MQTNKESINFRMSFLEFRNWVYQMQDAHEFENVCFSLGKNQEGNTILRTFFLQSTVMRSNEAPISLIKTDFIPKDINFKIKGYFESVYFLNFLKMLIQSNTCLRLAIIPEINSESSDFKFKLIFSDPDQIKVISTYFETVFYVDQYWADSKFNFEILLGIDQMSRLLQVFQIDATKKYIMAISDEREVFFQVYNHDISEGVNDDPITVIESLYSLNGLNEVEG